MFDSEMRGWFLSYLETRIVTTLFEAKKNIMQVIQVQFIAYLNVPLVFMKPKQMVKHVPRSSEFQVRMLSFCECHILENFARLSSQSHPNTRQKYQYSLASPSVS